MTSTRLVLVRHGQCEYAIEDGPLSELGRRQAQAVATALEICGDDIICASGLRRAIETAETFGYAINVVEGLREFDFGPQAPAAEALIEARVDLTLWRASDGFSGGETIGSFQKRVNETMEQLVGAYEGRRVIACTHAGFVDAAIRWAYGIGPDGDWLTEAEIPNASITEFEHWLRGRHPEGAPRHTLIRRIGDVVHLSPELRSDN